MREATQALKRVKSRDVNAKCAREIGAGWEKSDDAAEARAAAHVGLAPPAVGDAELDAWCKREYGAAWAGCEVERRRAQARALAQSPLSLSPSSAATPH